MKKTILFILVFLMATTSLFAKIQVLSVKGSVAYKDGRKWKPLRRNQTLSEGTKISSGVRSYAKIQLNRYNHTVTVKPLTLIKIYSRATDRSSSTHIGLRRGKINAKVPRRGRVKTIFKVSTPVATSSVRGTEENITYGPENGMTIEVVRGLIEGRNRQGIGRFISGRQFFQQHKGQGGPRHIMMRSHDRSVVKLFGAGTTGDETNPIYSYGDNFFDHFYYSDTGILDNQIGGTGTTGTIEINPDWPSK